MPEFNYFIVDSIDKITSDAVVISIKITPELKELYKSSAGQYVTLELEINGEIIRRSYSICSQPNTGSLKVGVKKVQNGIFSNYVNQKLKNGDSIRVGKPEGRFIWEPKKNENLMAIAAGSGTAPDATRAIMAVVDRDDDCHRRVIIIPPKNIYNGLAIKNCKCSILPIDFIPPLNIFKPI